MVHRLGATCRSRSVLTALAMLRLMGTTVSRHPCPWTTCPLAPDTGRRATGPGQSCCTTSFSRNNWSALLSVEVEDT